tara:strand:- start:1088 stop:1672 length:585 start_codon:yes stop_codon:yes gene_type:complete
MTISASQYSLAGNIFSGSLSNFKGVGEIPLPSGEWEMKSFEKISDAGNFTDLDYDSNNFYDDNLTFYLSKIDSIGLSATTVNLIHSGTEFVFRKGFLICNNDQQPELNIYKDINKSIDGFEEICIWNNPDFNQVQLIYGKCTSYICIDISYFLNRDIFKSKDESKIFEYSLLLADNLKAALNGDNYSLEFENNF